VFPIVDNNDNNNDDDDDDVMILLDLTAEYHRPNPESIWSANSFPEPPDSSLLVVVR
jgi:hypothetical protein